MSGFELGRLSSQNSLMNIWMEELDHFCSSAALEKRGMRPSNWFLNILFLFGFFLLSGVSFSSGSSLCLCRLLYPLNGAATSCWKLWNLLSGSRHRGTVGEVVSSRAARLGGGETLTVRDNERFETLCGTTPWIHLCCVKTSISQVDCLTLIQQLLTLFFSF